MTQEAGGGGQQGTGQDPQSTPSTSTSEGADPSPQGSQDPANPSSQEGGQDSNGQVSEIEEISVGAAPGATDFQDPLLKGKTPAEIERIVQTQQQALNEQNRELNKYHQEASTRQASAPTPGGQEEEQDPYGNDFLAPRFKKLEERLSRQLENSVKPIIDHTRQAGAQSVRERMRSELRHFTVLEPHIDRLIREQGGDPSAADENSLRFYYLSAVGLAQEQGVALPSSEQPQPNAPQPPSQPSAPQPTPQQPGVQPVGIPQHRPSSAPLPQEQNRQPVRQLTESERALAGRYFPLGSEHRGKEIKTVEDQHAAYRELQDAEIDEVVQPGFSRENW